MHRGLLIELIMAVEPSNLRTLSRCVRDATGYRAKAAEQDPYDLDKDERP